MADILYVDDDPSFLFLIKTFFEKSKNIVVDTSISPRESIKNFYGKKYDAIISDYEMPEMNGIEFLNCVRKRNSDIPFIIYSGVERNDIIQDAMQKGADFFIRKDGAAFFQFTSLYCAVTKCIEGKKLKSEISALKHEKFNNKSLSVEQLNNRLKIFNEVTIHDLLNQISNLKITGGLLNDYIKNNFFETDPNLDKIFAEMDSIFEVLIRLIEFTQSYQYVGVFNPSWQNLQNVINHSIFPISKPEICLTMAIPDIEVLADGLLPKVFYNLYDDAVRHGKTVTNISVSSIRSEMGITIIWEDNGIGIPDSDKELIFSRGYGKNSGLGLYLNREILKITDLTIKECGNEGKGARFEIFIPNNYYRLKILHTPMICS